MGRTFILNLNLKTNLSMCFFCIFAILYCCLLLLFEYSLNLMNSSYFIARKKVYAVPTCCSHREKKPGEYDELMWSEWDLVCLVCLASLYLGIKLNFLLAKNSVNSNGFYRTTASARNIVFETAMQILLILVWLKSFASRL